MEFPRLRRAPFGHHVLDPVPNSIKDIDSKEGIVSFYASAFDNFDSHDDRIRQGAYTKTIVEQGPAGKNRIRHLADHNPTHRIGRIVELAEDSHGLLVRSKMPQNHARARDMFIEYEEGMITEHSVGIDVVKYEPLGDGRYDLKELALWEVSAVSWGANEMTPVLDVKSMLEDPFALDHLAHRLRAIKSCLRRGITDETAIRLESELDAFKAAFNSIEDALRSDDGPLSKSTRDDAQPLTVENAIAAILNF